MFRLDVNAIRSSSSSPSESKHDADLAITVAFENGKKLSMNMRRDLTVGYLKLAIEKETHIPWFNLELSIHGRALADPLSLADYSELAQERPPNIDAAVNKQEDDNGEDEQVEEDMRRVGLDDGGDDSSEDDDD